MSERCNLDPKCTWPQHDASAHPCGKMHIPGSPCDYCGKPTPLDSSPCPDCWISLDTMPFADIRAIFFASDLSIDPVIAGGPRE